MTEGCRKIAVIEDEEPIRALVQTILTLGGYAVASTGDPTAAVDLVRTEAPDLVLCDIAMPGMDGYTVLRALQSDPSTARYPVVFLTAHRQFTERVRAFKFGVVDYITKPFSREVLLRKIERVIRGLERRSGVIEAGGQAAVTEIIEEVRREARTGVLSVKDESGESRVLIRAGEVVEGTTRLPANPGATAEFRELDPSRESIVSHDPSALPGSAASVPRFDDLPGPLRVVLVVDDNLVFRRFLRDLFAQQGFTVHEAADGDEALAIAHDRRPWLILTDVSMPRLDGFELCRRVRESSLLRHTPLVFLSGWDEYKDRYRGLEVGGDEFISKDTPVREMLLRVQLILRRYTEAGAGLGRRGMGLAGGIDVVGASGILQLCHQGRLTGVFTVRSDGRLIELRFRDGEVVGARSGELTGADAVYEFLAWTAGRFEFAPGDPGEGSPLGESVDQLVLEGARRLDEVRRRSAS